MNTKYRYTLTQKLAIVAFLLVLALTGFGGYYLWKDREVTIGNNQVIVGGELVVKGLASGWSLVDPEVIYANDANCGGIGPIGEQCLDYAVYNPSDINITSPDQFFVIVASFEKSDELTPEVWARKVFDGTLGSATTKVTTDPINNMTAASFETFMEDDVRQILFLRYVFQTETKRIVLQSSMERAFFEGGLEDMTQYKQLLYDLAMTVEKT